MSELVEIGSEGEVIDGSVAAPRFDDLADRLRQALVAQQRRLVSAERRHKAASDEATRLEGEREGMAAEARNRENMIQLLDDKMWGLKSERDVLASKNRAIVNQCIHSGVSTR